MQVLTWNNRVVSVMGNPVPSQYQFSFQEEEIVEAPNNVGIGWYKDGDRWLPPQREREKR